MCRARLGDRGTVCGARWRQGPPRVCFKLKEEPAGTRPPPVPSVGHNNLRDNIDISTLYNNIS